MLESKDPFGGPVRPDELVEGAALLRAIAHGKLDRTPQPAAPLDILAQQIVAMCAAEEWKESSLLEVIRRAYPYRSLSDKQFDEVVTMLSEGIASQRGRYGACGFAGVAPGRVSLGRSSPCSISSIISSAACRRESAAKIGRPTTR